MDLASFRTLSSWTQTRVPTYSSSQSLLNEQHISLSVKFFMKVQLNANISQRAKAPHSKCDPAAVYPRRVPPFESHGPHDGSRSHGPAAPGCRAQLPASRQNSVRFGVCSASIRAEQQRFFALFRAFDRVSQTVCSQHRHNIATNRTSCMGCLTPSAYEGLERLNPCSSG